jgi:hypothetical protein
MTSEHNRSADDNFAQEYEREVELYPAIRQAHLKLVQAQKRDRLFELGDVDSSRRFAFLSNDRSVVPVYHARYTLVPDSRTSVIAGIHKLIVRIPLVEDDITPGLGMPRKSQDADRPTMDVAVEAFNEQGESIRVLLNAEGLRVFNSASDIETTREEDLIFNGQHLRVLPESEQGIRQSELEREWFDICELEAMFSTYEPAHQDNAGSSIDNVA